jgi:uncharacterized repeat protein (TIGR01451 family)
MRHREAGGCTLVVEHHIGGPTAASSRAKRRLITGIVACACGFATSGSGAARTGGPDGFGYSFYDGASGCGYQFIDIAATGTFVVSGDDVAGVVTLAEPFDFYGMPVTSLVMSDNGYLSTELSDPGQDFFLTCPPDATVFPAGIGGRRIYVKHRDLLLAGGGSGLAQHFTTCPRPQGPAQSCTVLQWNDVEGIVAGGSWDMEAILYHATGEVVLQYGPGDPTKGISSGIGLQRDPTAPSSFTGLAYRCLEPHAVPDSTAVCFGRETGADLALDQTASTTSPAVGEAVRLTLTVRNTDVTQSQTGVEVHDPLPAGLSYLGDSCGGDFADGVWRPGTLAPGATATCTLDVRYDSCTPLASRASAFGDRFDPPGNNAADVVFGTNLVVDPSLENTNFANPDANPDWGETSTNFGTPLCSGFTCPFNFGGSVPRSGDFWAWFGGAGSFEDGTLRQTITLPASPFASLSFYLWNGGSGAPGVDSFEATVGGTQVFSTLDGDAAFTADYTRVTVDASAFADGNAHDFVFHGVQNTSQPLVFNLDDVEVLACGQATADLQLAKTVTPPAVPVGGTVVFALTATNQGPSGASGVMVTDTLPVGLDYVSDDCGGAFVAPTFTWTVGVLAAGATASCHVMVRVTVTGTFVNGSGVSADLPDTDPTDDFAQALVRGQSIHEIPTVDHRGLAIIALLLATAAVVALRSGDDPRV